MRENRVLQILKKYNLVKTVYQWFAFILVISVIVFHINTAKLVVKEFLIFLDVHISSGEFHIYDGTKYCYLLADRWVIEACIIGLIIYTVEYLAITIFEKYGIQRKATEEFEECLVDYIFNDKNNRSLLITGPWGVGKTFNINRFINKYSLITHRRYYKISCYGLNDRESVVREIANAIEHEDNSFFRRVIDILSVVPFLGNILSKLLRHNYDYKSIKKGTVFIFDDFERIACENAGTYLNMLNKTNGYTYYGINTYGNRDADGIQEVKEQINIQNRIIARNYDSEIKHKFVSILGFINDVMEAYGAKVIIICDISKLNSDIKTDIIRNKLNSRVYNMTLTENRRTDVINDMLTGLKNHYKNLRKNEKDFIDNYKDKIKILTHIGIFSNLRSFATILDAFISATMTLDNENLSDEFLLSLINSITLAHYLYYTKNENLTVLKKYKIGTNLYYLMDNINVGLKAEISFVRNESEYGDCETDIKWVGAQLASRWILNAYKETICGEEIKREWENYSFSEVESLIHKDSKKIFDVSRCRMDHILYCISRIKKEDFLIIEFRRLLMTTVETNKICAFDDVEKLLSDYAGQTMMGNENEQRDEVFVSFLLKNYMRGESKGYDDIHKLYNRLSREFEE